jgi:hypothetical protein
MPTKDLPYLVAPPNAGNVRRVVAALLRLASAALEVLAQRLGHEERQSASPALVQLEFYAEAGAPEGALYVNGHLVGQLHGVTRL